MSSTIGPAEDEMAHAETLPQLDASTLVDGERLEAEVKDMYRHVAREDEADLHFEVGRGVAEHLGYATGLLDAIPPAAVASFAGVGHHLDLAAVKPCDEVIDLGSGSGTDVFCAAVLVGGAGRVVGIDMTDEQLAKAKRLRDDARLLPRRVRGGAHRGPALRRRELRRRDVERRHQPLAGQGTGLRRGRARAPAGRPPGDLRHRQRPAAQGAHPAQRRPVGRLHRRRDPARATTCRRSRTAAWRSRPSARTRTASSPTARSTRAAPTRWRASRWWPSRRAVGAQRTRNARRLNRRSLRSTAPPVSTARTTAR